MFQRKCAYCAKDIPATITQCPYCRRDEKGQEVVTPEAAEVSDPKLREDLQQLGHDDPYIRKSAGERILQRGASAVSALNSMVQEHTHKGVPEAVRLLGRLRDRRSIKVLVDTLKVGDEEIRTNAVWALSQINDPQALDELLREVTRNNPAVQAYLSHKLATIQDPRVVPALLKLSQHTSREVSFQAIWALGETGDSSAIVPLRKLLGRSDLLLRSAAEAALRRLGGPVRRIYPMGAVVSGLLGVGLLAGALGWFFFYR